MEFCNLLPFIEEAILTSNTNTNTDFLQDFFQNGTVVSCGSDCVLLGWGKRSLYTAIPNTSDPVFFFPDFFLKESHRWFVHEHYAKMTLEDFRLRISSGIKFIPAEIQWKCSTEEVFKQAFNTTKNLIAHSTLQKAVPFIFSETSQLMQSERLAHSLQSLTSYACSRSIFIYGTWENAQGILGGTPELLFRLKKGHESLLETMACAGTYKASVSVSEFLNDPKERMEHQLVVQGLIDSLTAFGTVIANPIEVLKLPSLQHLVTKLEVKLYEDGNFDHIVKSLHPTPALGAYPREPGRKWLDDYQLILNRKRFGAPVGYVFANNLSHCYVAIRNVQWDEHGMQIGAGCGVVAGSILENEWQEVQLKIHAIRSMLAL